MIRLKDAFLALFIPAFLVLSGGCATSHYLTMKADGQPVDESVFSPRFKEKKYAKVIVMPPSGTARGAFESQIVLLEREFLRKGMTVISGAITGRVVMESTNAQNERKDEKASELSDLERALIMAKKTGADAILQLGEFRWTIESRRSRFFVAPITKDSNFKEVGFDEWKGWSELKTEFSSIQLIFVGKVVDVENGEVLATINMVMPANCALPDDYVATYRHTGKGNLVLEKESAFPYVIVREQRINGMTIANSESPWLTGARRNAETKLIAYVAGLVSAGGR